MSRHEGKPRMLEDLTKRYSFLFGRKWLHNPIRFVSDVRRSQKLGELASFLVWELLHRLRLYPRNRYLNFNSDPPLVLENQQAGDRDLRAQISRLFADRGLNVTESSFNWKLLFIKDAAESFGCVYPHVNDLYKSNDNGHSVTFVRGFPEKIKSLFISSRNTIFVCTKGAVYRSSDNGASFTKSLDLSTSESYFRHNNGMTEMPGIALLIGEYGNVWDKTRWKSLAYLYFSSDDGESWTRSDFLIRNGINKHVHVVKYCTLLKEFLLADGDNKKRMWIGNSSDSPDVADQRWEPVNKYHIGVGGYTSIVESNGNILCGTDYQGGTNFVVESRDGKSFKKKIVPDPYRRSPIDNMVRRKSKRGDEVWANLPFSTGDTKCLLMYTADSGKSWNRVIEYNRATHTVWLISSSKENEDQLYFALEDSATHGRIIYKVNDL